MGIIVPPPAYGQPAYVTTDEEWSISGTILNTLAYNIDTLDGRYGLAGLRTENTSVPGRHGSIRAKRKFREDGSFVLSMWVRGVEADGTIPADRTYRQIFEDNLTMIMELLDSSGGLLDVRRVTPHGLTRQCFADVQSRIDFSVKYPRPLGRFAAEMVVPDTFWQDLNSVFSSGVAGGALPQRLTMTEFAGGSAPMEDLVYTVAGPIDGPQIYQEDLDIWVLYSGSLVAGDEWVVDSSAWTSKVNGVNVSGQTSHAGHPRYMMIPPKSSLTPNKEPSVQLRGNNGGATTNLTVSGRRKYHS